VPSRQLSRYLERSLVQVAVVQTPTGPKVERSILPALEREGQGLRGDEIRAVFPELESFVDPALAAGLKAAEAELERVSRRARAAIELDRDAALERLTLAARHQGLPAAALEAHLQAARDHADALLQALRGVSVQLDSACGFSINR
jgi:ATP-dependent helicase HepA